MSSAPDRARPDAHPPTPSARARLPVAGVALRPGQPTDAGAVGAILTAFIDTTPWMPRIHTRAEDLSFAGLMLDRGWVTVAEVGGRIDGFIARDGAMIHALYVAERRRGHGIGSALLARMQREIDHLALWTFQANQRAQRFYLRHGFVESERTEGEGNDERLPDIRFVWRR